MTASWYSGVVEPIAHAANSFNGKDLGRVRIGIGQLFSEPLNADIHHVGAEVEVQVSDLLEYLLARKNLPRRQHQAFEQHIFALCQGACARPPFGQSGVVVQRDTALNDSAGKAAGFARNQGFQSNDQLFNKKGFGQLVVSPQFKAVEPV
jgi:hypothetical protein